MGAGLKPAPTIAGRLVRQYQICPCTSEVRRLLEEAAYQGLRVHAHPVFRDGGVNAAEVGMGDQVALFQVLGAQGRVFAVFAALNGIADQEGHAASAVVGTGAIVVDPAAELGEHQHDDVVSGVILAQVVEEALLGLGDVGPQLVVHADLVGVAIEAAVVAVEDAGAQVGLVHLRDALQLGSDRGVRVFNAGRVHARGHVEDVGCLHGVQAGLAQVVHNGAGSDGRGIQAGKPVKDLVPLFGLVNAGQQAEVVQVVHAGHRNAGQSQGAREAGAEADGGYHILLVGVNFLGGATQPALGPDLLGLNNLYIWKPPKIGLGFPWHQDKWYFNHQYKTGTTVATWSAIDAADKGNGCLYVIPGSHKQGVREHKELEGSQQGEFKQAEGARDEDGVAVEVPAGAVIWFNSQVLHKSTDNHSERFRRANIAHYMNAKGEWTRPEAINKKRPPMWIRGKTYPGMGDEVQWDVIPIL